MSYWLLANPSERGKADSGPQRRDVRNTERPGEQGTLWIWGCPAWTWGAQTARRHWCFAFRLLQVNSARGWRKFIQQLPSVLTVCTSSSFASVLKLEEQILQFSLPGLPVRLAQGSAAGLCLGDKGRLRCDAQVPYLKIWTWISKLRDLPCPASLIVPPMALRLSSININLGWSPLQPSRFDTRKRSTCHRRFFFLNAITASFFSKQTLNLYYVTVIMTTFLILSTNGKTTLSACLRKHKKKRKPGQQ